MSRCIIIAAGDFYGPLPKISGGDLVIAADAGIKTCQSEGVTPRLAVGDWDSVEPPSGVEKVNLPIEKDDTDTLAAIKVGLERGFREFYIFGGVGGKRIDHTLANIQSLVYISKRGGRGFLFGESSTITAITDSALRLKPLQSGDISVFAADGPAIGVFESCLKYSLSDATLTPDFPLGVSNSFIGRAAEISVRSGSLVVVAPKSAFE